MFGLFKKIEKIEVNEAYQNYLNDPKGIMIINVDELTSYDERHILGSENLPYRLVKDFEEYYPNKDIKYYFYSIMLGKANNAAKAVAKLGYDTYELSDYTFFKGDEEGLSVKKKKRKKR